MCKSSLRRRRAFHEIEPRLGQCLIVGMGPVQFPVVALKQIVAAEIRQKERRPPAQRCLESVAIGKLVLIGVGVLVDCDPEAAQIVLATNSGIGFSDAPDRKNFRYTFDHLAKVIDGFTGAISLDRTLGFRPRRARWISPRVRPTKKHLGEKITNDNFIRKKTCGAWARE